MILGYYQFEHLLLTHCTPTLIKRKLGSMFHLDNRYSDVHALVEYYDQILNLQGLRINLFFSHGRYKFVAKNPHACVWDESHISLDIYSENNI